jgi:quercetin dioxygenase-like cupin family protein
MTMVCRVIGAGPRPWQRRCGAGAAWICFRRVQTWDLNSLEVAPHQPEVLSSDSEGRAIAIQLPAGERLDEHQVHERAWLLVLSGAIEVDDSAGETTRGGAGLLALFDPNERHEVRASEDSRLLLLLSPWPGEGHPSQGK